MPNSPANNPVTNPPATINAASNSSSLNGTPRIIDCCSETNPARMLRRRGTRQRRLRARHARERSAERGGAGTGLDRLGCEMAAKMAGTGNAAEKPEDVAGDERKARAAG